MYVYGGSTEEGDSAELFVLDCGKMKKKEILKI